MILQNSYEEEPVDSMRNVRQGHAGLTEHGVTLTELLIVLAIISILAIALGFSYQGWMGSYKIEKATKDLYTDLMNTRTLAMSRNRMYFLTLVNSTSYSVREDTNDSMIPGDTVGGVTDLVQPSFPKTVEYVLRVNGAVAANQSVGFDKRGIMRVFNNANALVDPFPVPDPFISFTVAAGVDPDYNCIVISQSRIIMGKMNALGTACDAN